MGENKLKMTDLLLFFAFYVNNLHFTFFVRDNLKFNNGGGLLSSYRFPILELPSLGSIFYTIFIPKRDILNTLYYVPKLP